VNFKTPKLDAAVTAFKALFGSHTQLFRYGQFYVTKRTLDDLFAAIEGDLRGNPLLSLQPDQLENLIRFFKAKLSVPVMSVAVPVIMQMLDLVEHNGDMAFIRSLFQPSGADRANAQRDFEAIWSRPDIPSSPLWSGTTSSLGKVQAAFQLERDKCFQVLRAMARKLVTQRGITGLPAASILSEGAVGGAFVHDTVPGTQTQVPQQTIRYQSPAGLAAAIARMKAAIDAGGYVHCGVLSGARHENSVFPQPEHHVLVFAYDRIDGQDAFLFWDPDASHSNIDGTGWGDGFGVLLGTTGRLSTAIDAADLSKVDRDKDSPNFGDHLDQVRRHCYQVYYLQTLPMAKTVRVHARLLQAPSRSTMDEMLYHATMLYATYNIELIEASREVYTTPGTELDRFQILFVGDEVEDEPTADLADLHETLRVGGRELGVETAPTDIVVAFVRSLVPAARGCSRHPLERPGAVLSASMADQWTLAHQLGHLLGLAHGTDPDNLMFPSTEAIEVEPPQLTDEEVITILASPLAVG
jgi:hypothetical protein